MRERAGPDGVVLRTRAQPGGAGERASWRVGRWPRRGAGQVAVARHGLTRRARACGRTARGHRSVACARGGGLPSSARGEGRGAALAGSERERGRGAQVNRSGAGRAGRGSAVGPRGRGGGKERKGEKEKKKNGKEEKKKRKERRERERESGIRGATHAGRGRKRVLDTGVGSGPSGFERSEQGGSRKVGVRILKRVELNVEKQF